MENKTARVLSLVNCVQSLSTSFEKSLLSWYCQSGEQDQYERVMDSLSPELDLMYEQFGIAGMLQCGLFFIQNDRNHNFTLAWLSYVCNPEYTTGIQMDKADCHESFSILGLPPLQHASFMVGNNVSHGTVFNAHPLGVLIARKMRSIDEIRYWSKQLSPFEINQLRHTFVGECVQRGMLAATEEWDAHSFCHAGFIAKSLNLTVAILPNTVDVRCSDTQRDGVNTCDRWCSTK